jgi:hypothetical protein
MKKTIFGIVAVAAIALGSLTGCTKLGGTQSFTASNFLMSYGAYSTASLLSTIVPTSGNTLYGSSESTLLAGEETVLQDQIELFNKYYNMLSGYLEKQTDEIIQVTTLNDDPNFETVIEVKMDLGDGKRQSMILKYNVGQEVEEDEVDDDFDEEEESKFQGELILGTTVYPFNGVSETEDDEKKFKIKAKIDELNYVKMELKEEEDEVKYEYEISENGEVSITELKIENDEDQEFKIELSVEDNGVSSEYVLKQEIEDGITVTKVEYDVNGQEGVFFVNKTVNEFGEEVISYTIKPIDADEFELEEEIENEFGDIEDDEEDDD